MGLLLVGADWGVRLASLDILRLVGQAGWVVKLVLLALAVASVVSWAIIAFKWRELRRAAQDSEAFLEAYHEGSFDAAHEVARDLEHSPIAQVFLEAYGELGRIGTVIGIITAFEEIGKAGSASLAVVAPGIAEALIATAVGLAAAIPATIFYNHFIGELRRLGERIDLFAEEFLADLRVRGARPSDESRAAGP